MSICWIQEQWTFLNVAVLMLLLVEIISFFNADCSGRNLIEYWLQMTSKYWMVLGLETLESIWLNLTIQTTCLEKFWKFSQNNSFHIRKNAYRSKFSRHPVYVDKTEKARYRQDVKTLKLEGYSQLCATEMFWYIIGI